MQLPKQAIDEFKTAWKISFDEELTDERAETEASQLLQFTSLLVEAGFKQTAGEKDIADGGRTTDFGVPSST